MGNKPAKIEQTEVPVKYSLGNAQFKILDESPLDGGNIKVTIIDPRPVKPPAHYIQYMILNGMLDLDLDDPDLAPLFK